MHAFDRRTDRQTNRRTDIILTARRRLHSMQRGKNGWRVDARNNADGPADSILYNMKHCDKSDNKDEVSQILCT